MEAHGATKETQQSYAALADEISNQYEALRSLGYKHEFYPRNSAGIAEDPYYGNPR